MIVIILEFYPKKTKELIEQISENEENTKEQKYQVKLTYSTNLGTFYSLKCFYKSVRGV